MAVSLRVSAVDDLKALAPIMYHAFAEFNLSIGVPPSVDFKTEEVAEELMRRIFQSPKSYGITALDKASGQPIGAAFLHLTGQRLKHLIFFLSNSF